MCQILFSWRSPFDDVGFESHRNPGGHVCVYELKTSVAGDRRRSESKDRIGRSEPKATRSIDREPSGGATVRKLQLKRIRLGRGRGNTRTVGKTEQEGAIRFLPERSFGLQRKQSHPALIDAYQARLSACSSTGGHPCFPLSVYNGGNMPSGQSVEGLPIRSPPEHVQSRVSE